MTLYGYTSRAIPDPQIFADVLETRMKAKREGDMTTANCLKLVANTTYGASGAKFNELFDPLAMRSVCISGQLFLLELAGHLRQDVPDLEIVQLNTDGIMISFDDSQYEKVHLHWKKIKSNKSYNPMLITTLRFSLPERSNSKEENS